MKPVLGAGINWVLGIIVFLWIARLGVFGLGYQDLEAILRAQVSGLHVLVLLIAKLAATTAVYAWGGHTRKVAEHLEKSMREAQNPE